MVLRLVVAIYMEDLKKVADFCEIFAMCKGYANELAAMMNSRYSSFGFDNGKWL